MGHRLSRSQRTLTSPKTNCRKSKEKSGKRASALRSSIIIKIRMLKMESKELNNLKNVKCDQNSKCSCNDNNGHQSTNVQHNQYVQPDTQSNMKRNEEIEHLEDRINQINNDNSINNNIINDNEINTESIDRHDMEGKCIICDNGLHITFTAADRIEMELQNIDWHKYIRQKLRMCCRCDNRNITNTMFLSSFDDRNSQCVDTTNVKTSNNSSIYPNVNNATALTTTIPSTSKGPDYVPMAPIKSSDKIPYDQNESELTNSQKRTEIASDEDCAVCHGPKDRQKVCSKCIPDTKDTKDKESKSKITNWSKKFNCVKILSPKSSSSSHITQLQQQPSSSSSTKSSRQSGPTETNNSIVQKQTEMRLIEQKMVADAINRLLDFDKFNALEYPIEDCDELARAQRAREIHEGVDPPPGHRSITVDPLYIAADPADQSLENRLSSYSVDDKETLTAMRPMPDGQVDSSSILNSTDAFPNIMFNSVDPQPRIIHSQEDFIHCLVPDLRKITNCGFYWGKMDRYEAERLLEGKPEGTFLLRDSAQEEFLFSVSFRKYGRSLHARIEQFNHKFSFDCHDPGVFTSPEVTGLLEHYKDPACVMFFEPALTQPLNRNFSFTLQQLCRSLIVSNTTYDGINALTLPSTLKSYLKEYHYKQRVRVRRYDQ